MSQRRFADSIPVCLTLLLLPLLIRRRTYESFQEEFAGAVYATEGMVIARARLDVFESPKQILLLYTDHLRTNHRECKDPNTTSRPCSLRCHLCTIESLYIEETGAYWLHVRGKSY